MTHAPITRTRPQAGGADVLPKSRPALRPAASTDIPAGQYRFGGGQAQYHSLSGNLYHLAYTTHEGGRDVLSCDCIAGGVHKACYHMTEIQRRMDCLEWLNRKYPGAEFGENNVAIHQIRETKRLCETCREAGRGTLVTDALLWGKVSHDLPYLGYREVTVCPTCGVQ